MTVTVCACMYSSPSIEHGNWLLVTSRDKQNRSWQRFGSLITRPLADSSSNTFTSDTLIQLHPRRGYICYVVWSSVNKLPYPYQFRLLGIHRDNEQRNMNLFQYMLNGFSFVYNESHSFPTSANGQHAFVHLVPYGYKHPPQHGRNQLCHWLAYLCVW